MKNKLIENIKALVKQDGYSNTYLDNVKVFYSQESLNRHKVIYENCIIIVGQGSKKLYLKNDVYQYDNDNYLIVPATLPLECETSASPEIPFYGIILKIDLDLLQNVAKNLSTESKKLHQSVIYTSKLTEDLTACTIRLLETLQTEEKAKLFANNILQELYYYLLKESNSSVLYSLMDDNSQLSRIHRSLNYIYANLDQELLIPKLAELSGMSVATYYRFFKKLTNKAPLQLIKETRLTKAKQLIQENNYKASQAANEVGYQSYSQFSREFKRLFLISPKNI